MSSAGTDSIESMSPPLGIVVHGLVGGVLLAAGVAMAIVDRSVGHVDGDAVNVVALVVGAGAISTAATAVALWYWRRRPFDREPPPTPGVWRLAVALVSGVGVGTYGAAFGGWISFSDDVLLWAVFPVTAVACTGDGVLRGLARVGFVHIGAQVGGHLGIALRGEPWQDEVLGRNIAYLVHSTLIVFAGWQIGRWVFRGASRPRRPVAPGDGAPRRAP